MIYVPASSENMVTIEQGLYANLVLFALGLFCFFLNMPLLYTLLKSSKLRSEAKMLILMAFGDSVNCLAISALGLYRYNLYSWSARSGQVPLQTARTCAERPSMWLRSSRSQLKRIRAYIAVAAISTVLVAVPDVKQLLINHLKDASFDEWISQAFNWLCLIASSFNIFVYLVISKEFRCEFCKCFASEKLEALKIIAECSQTPDAIKVLRKMGLCWKSIADKGGHQKFLKLSDLQTEAVVLAKRHRSREQDRNSEPEPPVA
ncbi:unnamed protein product [Nippostrongylus brasiliensis]|uniref:G_PROTEIN_RECEP_F1_2 domain-containing protein n=1 Tax=Nippostrongylus brasiliensis TaxID=27835 RepID=A0A158QXW0_NIPBR|nr:unnamed protein product [Nippostrongylus brasiliensis]